MATSDDFYKLFKTIFNLKELGLWWSQARTKIRGGSGYSRAKFVIHVEIDNSDIAKVDKMKHFFSESSKKVDNNILGPPMTFLHLETNLNTHLFKITDAQFCFLELSLVQAPRCLCPIRNVFDNSRNNSSIFPLYTFLKQHIMYMYMYIVQQEYVLFGGARKVQDYLRILSKMANRLLWAP